MNDSLVGVGVGEVVAAEVAGVAAAAAAVGAGSGGGADDVVGVGGVGGGVVAEVAAPCVLRLKRCPRCKEEKRLGEFGSSKFTSDGLATYCLECERLRFKRMRAAGAGGVALDAPPVKLCPWCGREKVLDEFGKNKANKNGLATYCLECESMRQRRYRSMSIPYTSETLLDWAREKSKRKGLKFDLDQHSKEFKARVDRMRCELSGIQLYDTVGAPLRPYNSISLDRIIPNGGYTYDNVRIVCWMLNAALGGWGADYLVLVFDEAREKMIEVSEDPGLLKLNLRFRQVPIEPCTAVPVPEVYAPSVQVPAKAAPTVLGTAEATTG